MTDPLLLGTEWTLLPFPEELDLHGHLDGYVLTWSGRVLSHHGNSTSAGREITKVRHIYAVLGDVPANENGVLP